MCDFFPFSKGIYRIAKESPVAKLADGVNYIAQFPKRVKPQTRTYIRTYKQPDSHHGQLAQLIQIYYANSLFWHKGINPQKREVRAEKRRGGRGFFKDEIEFHFSKPSSSSSMVYIRMLWLKSSHLDLAVDRRFIYNIERLALKPQEPE